MDDYYDPDLWDVTFEDFAAFHEEAIRDPDFNGPPLGHPCDIALVLGGYTRGVYVSTSRFSRGAREAARRSTQTVMPIELIDAGGFFDILGYAQLKRRPRPEDCNITRTKPLTFHGHDYYNLNTL